MKNYSKEMLEQMYTSEKLSLMQMARRLKCSPITITRYVKSYRITLRSVSEANERRAMSIIGKYKQTQDHIEPTDYFPDDYDEDDIIEDESYEEEE